ncbi:MAG: NAD(P)-dependent oxidoreductase [Acidobacteriota bacterium]|nr:NAD(P)-dependent oxidoreductase [Acidobacteriota bacterium]
MDSAAPTAGVVGLGQIGGGAAGAIARAGLALSVHDVVAGAAEPFAASARIADSPADVAATSDVVAVAVVDDAQVMAVVEGPGGVLDSARPGTTVVVLSTVSLDTLQAVAGACAARGVHVVDCGVSGGPVAAAEGELVSMLGGEPQDVAAVRPVLDAFSSLVVHMGPLGAGLQAKLARNLMQYACWLAAYEAQVLAEAAGIELAKLAEVVRASDAKIGGPTRLMFRPTVDPLPADTHPQILDAFERGARLAHKDLQAALALGDRLGVSLPLAAMTDARADAVFGLGADPLGGRR